VSVRFYQFDDEEALTLKALIEEELDVSGTITEHIVDQLVDEPVAGESPYGHSDATELVDVINREETLKRILRKMEGGKLA
jgi:hypothetical protein